MLLVASSFQVGTQRYSSVSNKNFVAEQSPGSGYEYRAYGELSHFVYCILQKIRKSESLPLVEKWQDYMLPNHSSFAAIDEEHFLVGTRIHAALAKLSSSYLRKEFRNNARRFLDEFCSTILSTVAARSKLGQGVSCFCPEIILGGDDHSAFFLHGQLLDGLVECGWEKGSHVEACKAEFQSFVREQRQLERHSTRKRPDIGNILAYFAHQSGFRSRRHLFRVSCRTSSKVGFIVSTNCQFLLQVYQLTTLFLRDSVEELPAFTVKLNGIGFSHRFMEKSIACVQDFVRSPRFTQRDFFSDNGVNLLVSAVNAAGSMRDQSTCEPWTTVLPDGYEATLVDLRKAYDVVVVRRKEARDTSERWFGVRSVESSEVGEPSCRAGVRISNVVEVGQVEYLPGSVPARDQPCGSTTVSPRSPGKGKRKRSVTPVPAIGPKRLFEFDDESVVLPKRRGVYFEDPNFECALKSQEKTAASRRSGRSRRAAPVFQSSPR